MKRILSIAILSIFLLSLFPSCGAPSETDSVGRAREAFEAGRYVKAQALCDSLVIGDNFSRLSVDQLCRLSMLFVSLGEVTAEEGANTAFAAYAVRRAMELNRDSVMTFAHSLPMEDQASFMMLTVLSQTDNAQVSDIDPFEDEEALN